MNIFMKTTEFNDAQRVKFRDNMAPQDENGCQRWKKSYQASGYGNSAVNGIVTTAHRVSYAMFNGDIEDGLFVRHTCDNRWCVSPEHLVLGTNVDNMQDVRERYPNQRVVTGSGEEHFNAKLTEQTVVELRKRIAEGETTTEVAQAFGVSQTSVARAATGETWGFVPGALSKNFLETKGSRHGAAKRHRDKIAEQERTGLKFCKSCDSSKSLSEFGKNKRMLDGLAQVCKECSRAARNKVYKKKRSGQVL